MPLVAGTGAIGMNPDGSPTYVGSGLALARAQDQDLAPRQATLATFGF